MKPAILYITYDGILEPLGQSQVLAYQELLAKDYDIHLLSYEKPSDWADVEARKRIAARMENAGIHWHPRKYHKKPSAIATAYDIAIGIAVGLRLILSNRIRIVHARSYVPSVISLALKRMTGVKYIFDMRGFWADERVDGGLWPRAGRMYRVAKWFERKFLLATDHIVSLSYAAIDEMKKFDYMQSRFPPVTVISTCADLNRFVPSTMPNEPFVLGYVGSVGTWYLFDETVKCFALLRQLRPDVKIQIINRKEHQYIKERLQAGGIDPASVELRSANYDEVPALMQKMHASIFFIKPVFSKQASAPTKLGELLACGIPCLGNAGIGDMAKILEENKVGVAINSLDSDALQNGLQQLISLVNEPGISGRCRNVAERYFSLEEGVKKYAQVYESLLVDSK